MKKLMIAAAVAAMGTGAFSAESTCTPAEPEEVQVSRIYQIEFKTYTTKGVLVSATTTTQGSTCVPGESTTVCTVKRGKDKTVIRGYIYACQALCQIDDYLNGFVDSKRKALFGEIDEQGEFKSTAELKIKNYVFNFMGVNNTDVEVAWDFTGTVTYDSVRAQTYTLVGAGYGKLGNGATIFADKMSGYFAGTVTAPYDLTTKSSDTECICSTSKVLQCDGYASLAYTDADSVAFGSWKMRFNANDSQAYYDGNWNVVTALKKIMK